MLKQLVDYAVSNDFDDQLIILTVSWNRNYKYSRARYEDLLFFVFDIILHLMCMGLGSWLKKTNHLKMSLCSLTTCDGHLSFKTKWLINSTLLKW